MKSEVGWLFVLPWSLEDVGGVNEVLKNLIRRFRHGGAFVPHLLITDERLRPACSAAAAFIQADYMDLWPPISNEEPVALPRSFLLRFPHRCWKLGKIIRQHNIKVINLHFPELNSLLFVFMKQLRLFRGRLILSFHGTDIRSARRSEGVERAVWKLLLRQADCVVAVSDDLAREVLALEPRAAGRLKTIYNGVDLALFAPAINSHSSEANSTDSTKTVLSIGRFVKKKGHDTLVRAFCIVAAKVPEAKLVIVGVQDSERETLQQLIDCLSLTENVTTYGDVHHERIPDFLSKAAVFALASRAEGFGLVVAEAAASRVPVVCTRASGLRELISDRVTGRLVEVDDEIALGEAIVDVLTHPKEAQAMAARFYEQVANSYTWDQAYRKYLETISQKTPIFVSRISNRS